MRRIDESTLDFARKSISVFKRHKMSWPELRSPAVFVHKIERQLEVQKLDNLLDVEDVINQLIYDVVVLGRYAKLGKAVKFVLSNTGNIKTDQKCPTYTEPDGKSNNDDLQGGENVPNKIDCFLGSEIVPGSDTHVACIDIEEVFGKEARELFELKLAGTTNDTICSHLNLSRSHVVRLWSKMKSYIRKNEYDIGSVVESKHKSNWNKSRHQSQRTWELPKVDHRNIIEKNEE